MKRMTKRNQWNWKAVQHAFYVPLLSFSFDTQHLRYIFLRLFAAVNVFQNSKKAMVQKIIYIQKLCKQKRSQHHKSPLSTHTRACTDIKWDLPLTRLARVQFWTPCPSRQCLVKTKKWQKLKMWPHGLLNGMQSSAGDWDVSNDLELSKIMAADREGSKWSMHVEVGILGTVQLLDIFLYYIAWSLGPLSWELPYHSLVCAQYNI